jgi:hypothetical protein
LHKPKYLYKSEQSFNIYEFTSEGKNGLIRKMVEFQKTEAEGIFNLAFGDYDERTQAIDDLKVTNNGDSQKVLATVASIVFVFMEKHSRAMIYATGSTDTRTRLYRMGISTNIQEIKADFNVYGLRLEGLWEEFAIGEDYQAFLISKIENKLVI